MVMKYIKLLRPLNLLMIALLMGLVRIFVFEKGLQYYGPSLFALQFSTVHFWKLVASVVLIAAGGNVINDIYDQEIDSVNKPDKKIVGTFISETKAWVLYFILSLGGIALGYHLALEVNNTAFTLFHLFSPLLLWVYAAQLKKSALVGNIVIALLAASVPLLQLTYEYGSMLPVYWDVIKMNESGNPLTFMIEWCFYLAAFAFLSTLIREIIKDLEDIEGDKRYGARTLPIVIGGVATKKTIIILSMLFIAALYASLFVLSIFERPLLLVIIYQSLSVVLIIGFGIVKLLKAQDKKDFSYLSNLWKIVMLVGFGSCVIYGLL